MTDPSIPFAMVAMCVAAVLLLVYFLPWFVAVLRMHENKLAIFVLTLFLGWTFLGWVVALVWAFIDQPRLTHYRK